MTLLFPLLMTYLLALLAGTGALCPVAHGGRCCSGLRVELLLAASKAGLGDAPLFWILIALTGPVFLAMGNVYRTAALATRRSAALSGLSDAVVRRCLVAARCVDL